MPAPHPWMPVHFSYIGGSPAIQKELRVVKTSKQGEMRGDEKRTPDLSWAHPDGKKEEKKKGTILTLESGIVVWKVNLSSTPISPWRAK